MFEWLSRIARAYGIRSFFEYRFMSGEPTESKQLPTLDEVLAYAKNQVEIYIRGLGASMPKEQKDEVRQIAYIRVLEAYQALDPNRGWKSYLQRHCKGAVQDYLRAGHGFEECSESLRKEGGDPGAIRHRIEVTSKADDAPLDVGDVAGIFGIHSESDDGVISNARPHWDLVARLASRDEDVHLVAKLWLGFTQTELAERFGVSRERLSQRLREFFDRLDSPENIGKTTVEQTIYAFGLCDYFHMPAVDNGYGWDFEPIDLIALDSVQTAREGLQPSLFSP